MKLQIPKGEYVGLKRLINYCKSIYDEIVFFDNLEEINRPRDQVQIYKNISDLYRNTFTLSKRREYDRVLLVTKLLTEISTSICNTISIEDKLLSVSMSNMPAYTITRFIGTLVEEIEKHTKDQNEREMFDISEYPIDDYFEVVTFEIENIVLNQLNDSLERLHTSGVYSDVEHDLEMARNKFQSLIYVRSYDKCTYPSADDPSYVETNENPEVVNRCMTLCNDIDQKLLTNITILDSADYQRVKDAYLNLLSTFKDENNELRRKFDMKLELGNTQILNDTLADIAVAKVKILKDQVNTFIESETSEKTAKYREVIPEASKFIDEMDNLISYMQNKDIVIWNEHMCQNCSRCASYIVSASKYIKELSEIEESDDEPKPVEESTDKTPIDPTELIKDLCTFMDTKFVDNSYIPTEESAYESAVDAIIRLQDRITNNRGDAYSVIDTNLTMNDLHDLRNALIALVKRAIHKLNNEVGLFVRYLNGIHKEEEYKEMIARLCIHSCNNMSDYINKLCDPGIPRSLEEICHECEHCVELIKDKMKDIDNIFDVYSKLRDEGEEDNG